MLDFNVGKADLKLRAPETDLVKFRSEGKKNKSLPPPPIAR
jgi:hypothetical protein